MPHNTVLHGPCLGVLQALPDDSIDTIVTDPPYGLGTKEPTPAQIEAYLRGASLNTGGDFMGKAWEIPTVETWRECLRVLKPGRHVCAFAGTRTWDIMLAGMEAAGFTREGCLGEPFGMPMLAWLHGQGFPKSLNISKAIGKMAGPAEEVKKWEGWGTALKPAWEPIITLRKPGPLPEGLPPLLIPFLYCAKVTKSEADAGIDARDHALGRSDLERNTHPTRKPVTLMEWLIKHVAAKDWVVLDPYCGSGSTLVAAAHLGRDFLGIEREAVYQEIAVKRTEAAVQSSMAGARNVFEMLMMEDD